MDFYYEGEFPKSFVNDPSSLEGRLLFAIPKSESTSNTAAKGES
jgi:hypothetical protein